MSLRRNRAPADPKTCSHRASAHGLQRHGHSWSRRMNCCKESLGESPSTSNSLGTFAAPFSGPRYAEGEEPRSASTWKAKRDRGPCAWRTRGALAAAPASLGNWDRAHSGCGRAAFETASSVPNSTTGTDTARCKRSVDGSPVPQPRRTVAITAQR